ncbi:MAG: TonB-dependent receptor [Polyangiales bacterium]
MSRSPLHSRRPARRALPAVLSLALLGGARAVHADAPPPAPEPPPAEPVPPVAEPEAEPATAPVPPADELSSVVVTGTRRTDRTLFDSNAPVDVVSANDLRTSASPDLNNRIQQTVPSFNVQRLPLFDGAIFNRPATLRGLAPDQTLVLVNGKRRHRSAYIDVTAQGAQAVDLAEIPLAAIARIEVLRDGASAQYGSDAIAGVLNILLKDKPGYDAYLQFGRYYEGDGNGYLGGVNAGWALGERGTLNLSLEGSLSDATSRSNQRPAAQALIDAGNTDVRRPVVQRFGQPDSRSVLVFLDGKLRLWGSTEAYTFGSFGYKWGENDFNYRSPTQGGVFTSTQKPEVFDPNFAGLDAPYQDWYRNNPAAFAGYAGGFTPRFSAESLDGSGVVGFRGDITPALSWDLSGRYGSNHIAYHLGESINASQGPFSKKSFDTGSKRQTEWAGNLDFVYAWQVGLPTPVNVAFGGEVRREGFESGAGEPDSYAIGPLGRLGLAGGANGFFGTSPDQAGSWSRRSGAGYLDVDADILRPWNLGAAVRAEHYSDAGNTINGKVSTRIAVLPEFNLRGGVSTGFRAPTPGQQNLTNTNQNPSADGSTIETNGTIPPTNPIAVTRGGVPLKSEKSLNLSFGFVVQPLKDLTFSLDAYRIDVRDRIGLSQRNTLTAEQQSELVASGVPAAQGLSSFNFFVNGYETRTEGIDLVFTYGVDLAPKQRLSFTASANFNKTRVRSFEQGVIDARQRQYLEERLPKRVSNWAVEYVLDRLGVTARLRDYAGFIEPLQTTTDENGRLPFNQKFGNELFVDLLASYELARGLRLTLGAENILDNYPDKARFPNTLVDAAAGKIPSTGRIYPSQRPYEADGGRYYARLTATF